MNFFVNPYSRAVKKYIFDLLPQNYTEEIDEVADRIAINIASERDTKKFLTLLGAVYSAGYTKAMADTKDRLAEQGIRLKITKPAN